MTTEQVLFKILDIFISNFVIGMGWGIAAIFCYYGIAKRLEKK